MQTATARASTSRTAVLVAVAAIAAYSACASGQGGVSQALESLEKAFPGVMVHESGDRVRIVYGVPMTTGKTAREAAEEWLTEYVGVFGQDDPDLTERSVVETNSGKTFLAYRQSIDGLPVEGSRVTVVVGAGETPTVAYVAARVGLRPKAGFGEPKLTTNQALAAAGKHQQASGLTSWGTPALIAFYNESLKSGAEAAQVYKCIGSNAALTESYSFYVDAASGDVLMVVSNIMHSADITGTVSAYATQRVEPHTWGDDKTPGTLECPNDPELFDALPYALIEAVDKDGVTIIDSVFADGDGDYTLDVPSSTEVDVRAWLIGPAWEVHDDRTSTNPPNPPLADPIAYVSNPVTAPMSAVNLRFNPSSPFGEFDTANVNAHLNMGKTWRYFKDRFVSTDPVPGLDDLLPVWTNRVSLVCQAAYDPSNNVLRFGATQYGISCGNQAYSTIVSHEYGHYLLYNMLDITVVSPHAQFHEGFGDTLAHLLHDTDVYGYNIHGCDEHERTPLDPRVEYPHCGGAPHESGTVLSGTWLDVLINIGDLEVTRQLHVDWCFLTGGGATGAAGCTTVGQSAHLGTLAEVLTADDDDSNLGNGTPHRDDICDAFNEHGIWDTDLCGSTRPAGAPFSADCDRNGQITVADWACFQTWYATGSRSADCNHDGHVDPQDVECMRRQLVGQSATR